MNSNVFNDANYKRLYKASKVVVIPGFVKSAPAAEEQNFDKTASDLFADSAQRRYPVDTKSNTWLSRMYFSLDKEAYERGVGTLIENKITEAAEYWNLEGDQVIPQVEKVAYEFPLTLGGNGEQPIHVVRIADKDQYVQAANDLVASMSKIAYVNRREYARGLRIAPDEFKADLPEATSEYIEKAAGFGMCTRMQVGKTLISRVSLLRSRPEYSAKLREVGENLPASMKPSLLHKVAEIIDNVDRDCDFTRYYGKGLSSPEESLFYVTEKTAQLVIDEMVPLTNGNVIHKTAIKNDAEGLVDKFFVDYYGEKPYGEDLQEKIAVIESLPANDADALQKLTGLK